jgi:hypothetical protein
MTMAPLGERHTVTQAVPPGTRQAQTCAPIVASRPELAAFAAS